MQTIDQSPTETDFVQNPYPAYETMRAYGPLVYWSEFNMVCATTHEAVHTLLRDRRFGRETPSELRKAPDPHTQAFYDVEAHSLLELEAPRHTRLRGLVLRAFTSRRIKALEPEITQLSHDLVDRLPDRDCDILTEFCQPLPVIIIARLLGVPEEMAPQLLKWSNAMVAMYMAKRDRAVEDAANTAAREFSDFMRAYIEKRRHQPADDLITHLIAAEEDGEKLTTDEMITTCILLLNAGHEATVHTLGNGLKALLENGIKPNTENSANITEEIMRYDPPLHMFTRHVYEEVEMFGHTFQRGDQVGLLLASAGHDPATSPDPTRFIPDRPKPAHLALGGGIHFCVGAPLARLEISAALPVLFEQRSNLALNGTTEYANIYHFHGLKELQVTY